MGYRRLRGDECQCGGEPRQHANFLLSAGHQDDTDIGVGTAAVLNLSREVVDQVQATVLHGGPHTISERSVSGHPISIIFTRESTCVKNLKC